MTPTPEQIALLENYAELSGSPSFSKALDALLASWRERAIFWTLAVGSVLTIGLFAAWVAAVWRG